MFNPDKRLKDEQGRIASLNRYCVLDSGSESHFDRITELVRSAFRVPIATVSLIDVNRQWYKSQQGLDITETRRDVAFCAHTILSRDALNISDAWLDPRFCDNPLVTGYPHVRAYLGVPLETPDGYNVGALCAIDTEPRDFDAAHEAMLANFAALVVDELELRMIGQSDDLTGAKTRRAFMADLEAACDRPGEASAVIMLDLDHFKRVNDRFGHPMGDDVLRAVAAVIRSAIRQTDVIGRLGGEEFAIVLRGMNLTRATECAERIRQSVAALTLLPDPRARITVSSGIAAVIPGNAQATIADADTALYCAKENGRNRCVAMTGIVENPASYPFLRAARG